MTTLSEAFDIRQTGGIDEWILKDRKAQQLLDTLDDVCVRLRANFPVAGVVLMVDGTLQRGGQKLDKLARDVQTRLGMAGIPTIIPTGFMNSLRWKNQVATSRCIDPSMKENLANFMYNFGLIGQMTKHKWTVVRYALVKKKLLQFCSIKFLFFQIFCD